MYVCDLLTFTLSPNTTTLTIPLLPTFLKYANEARIVWNAPLQHEADEFLCECVDHYFGEGKKWHFYSIDKKATASQLCFDGG